jgi:hypothetical protein
MNRKKIITLCSSVAFYGKTLEISKQLRKMGYTVVTPNGVLKRSKDTRFASDAFKKNFESQNAFKMKSYLMKDHFRKIHNTDAVLVVNEAKKSMTGYIGPNVLMEMAITFDHKKMLFILNKPSKNLALYEEVMGLSPIILEGNLESIKKRIG